MSIRIRFSLEPKKKIFSGIVWNGQSAEGMAKELAKEMGYRCFRIEGFLIVQLCQEGYVWLKWSKSKLQGESQTNIAGPGFHVAAIDFLERLADKEKLKLRLEDRTGYYIKRDFLAMRQKYFYQWFSDLMKLVSGWSGDGEYMFCWPAVYYIPDRQEGKLVTHIRSFSFKEIKGMMHSGIGVAFARDFFVWNELEMDAYYYRNSAMVLLHQFCYFMPSARSRQDEQVNQQIIEFLETSLSMDRRLPFPKKEYLEVCSLDGHVPVDLEGVTALPEEVSIGCRKHLVYRKIGNMSFGIPGNFLYDESNSGSMDHYYDGNGYGGHDYYIYAAVFEGRKAEFKKQWFEQGKGPEIVDFDVEKAKARVAFYEPEEKEGEILYGMSAQVLYKEQRMNINIISRKPGERDWALGLIKNIKITE
ncbi:hypothetical protein [Lacrimispora sp.]|jgi:hypothetical protein|uniref:hypothetical protein n=1 Tax=Lacrimispora sp. TaxID=2719234 RepID=UPI0028578C98|nr:hypothetical protein [Lacrimispora sp.]MDR7814493.1 hypothetical protein [Lacrimispora sp.]